MWLRVKILKFETLDRNTWNIKKWREHTGWAQRIDPSADGSKMQGRRLNKYELPSICRKIWVLLKVNWVLQVYYPCLKAKTDHRNHTEISIPCSELTSPARRLHFITSKLWPPIKRATKTSIPTAELSRCIPIQVFVMTGTWIPVHAGKTSLLEDGIVWAWSGNASNLCVCRDVNNFLQVSTRKWRCCEGESKVSQRHLTDPLPHCLDISLLQSPHMRISCDCILTIRNPVTQSAVIGKFS